MMMSGSKVFELGGLKLHLGCGTIYLTGFVNIDVRREGYSFLASERPDLVEKNRTLFGKYYKTEITKELILEKGEEPRWVVADRFLDITALDYSPDSVDAMVCVQTLEHFTRAEVQRALKNWFTILRPGGVLHLDVPDFEETAKLLLAQKSEEDKEWYYRLIFGSQKDHFSIHKDGYSEAKLRKILSLRGFRGIRRLTDNRHFYPSILVECTK